MDVSARNISFDSGGVCTYCHAFDAKAPVVEANKGRSEQLLEELSKKIIKAGKRREYDCVVGISGGVDSSYVALMAKKLGLRPLAVHFDNGWNSEIAISNIRNIIDKLEFDFSTYVIDWPEFRDLQRAFLKAGVVDIEMLTDHAINAAMYSIAKDNDIKFILSGGNFATEHGMPQGWGWKKSDATNIKSIHRRYGNIPLKSFPFQGTWTQLFMNHFGHKFEKVRILDMIRYRKLETMDILKKELGWRDYGGKHYESQFTKFYQAYILPTKFGIDKRRVHLSALIRNKEITRIEALKELEKPLYASTELTNDKEYICKKLGFTISEFDHIMTTPPVPHNNYLSDETSLRLVFGPINRVKRLLGLS